MSAPPELVIFDCDGVLVDSERLTIKVDLRALREVGWHMTEAEVIRRFVGRSDSETQLAIEAHLGRPLVPGWAERLKPPYEEVLDAELVPVAGVVEALDPPLICSCTPPSRWALPLRVAWWWRTAGQAWRRREPPACGCWGFAGGVTPAGLLEGPDTVLFHDMRELPGLLERMTVRQARPVTPRTRARRQGG